MFELLYYVQAITQDYTVFVNSSDGVSNTVNQLPNSPSFRGNSKNANSHPLFDPPKNILINPAKLFFSLGKITKPQNIYLNRINNLWPFLKYYWIFDYESTRSNLILSENVKDIDFHQKSLMSDDLGIGMAALITEQYFNGLHPVDVSYAIQHEIYGRINQLYNTSPDYLFKTIDGNYIIVECKGSQSGRNYAFKQLKRGTEQVSSLVFPSGEDALSLVISTCFEENVTDVRIIDPPMKKGSDYPKKYQITNPVKFNKTVDRLQILNLYLYCGDFSNAARLMREFFPEMLKKYRFYKYPPVPTDGFFPEIDSKYYGQSTTVILDNEKIKIFVFQGLYEGIYKELSPSVNMSSINEIAATQYKKVKASKHDNNEKYSEFDIICESTIIDSKHIISLISIDGRMMQIAFEYLK